MEKLRKKMEKAEAEIFKGKPSASVEVLNFKVQVKVSIIH